MLSLRVVYVVNINISFHLGTYQQMALDILKEEGSKAVDEALLIAKELGVQDVKGEVLSGYETGIGSGQREGAI